MFGKMPTKSTVTVFNHEKAFGFIVNFSEQNFGFGEITFAVDKVTGEVRFEPEEMSPEHCGQIVERTAGNAVLSLPA